MYRKTYMEIDAERLKKNIKTLCLLMMNGNHYGGQTQKMGPSGR